jgi:hypothetical protein
MHPTKAHSDFWQELCPSLQILNKRTEVEQTGRRDIAHDRHCTLYSFELGFGKLLMPKAFQI